MPSRILREGILTSERVNKLSLEAEVFYRRLMSVVDDYGRFYAHPTILRTSCFPLKVDQVTERLIRGWLSQCEKAGLLEKYRANGKDYLQMADFRQQTRAKASKFPADPPVNKRMISGCEADAKQMRSKCEANAHLSRSRSRISNIGVVVGADRPVDNSKRPVETVDNSTDLLISHQIKGIEADKVNAALKRLQAWLGGDPGPVLAQFLLGFGSHPPGPELIATEFERLAGKVCSAKRDRNGSEIKNFRAYAERAVQKYHQERKEIAASPESAGSGRS